MIFFEKNCPDTMEILQQFIFLKRWFFIKKTQYRHIFCAAKQVIKLQKDAQRRTFYRQRGFYPKKNNNISTLFLASPQKSL
jgi:hypothetical protein